MLRQKLMNVKFELEIINKNAIPHLLLIIYDFWHIVRKHKFLLGQVEDRRLVQSALLNITKIDPFGISYFLSVLNPERVSMPDIDIDFCIKRRGEVIDYISEKYGDDHVAQIVTFGTMAARGVVRDAGRALGVPPILLIGLLN